MNELEKLKRENEALTAKYRSLESKSTSLESANKSLAKTISKLESTNASLVGDAKSLVAANEELTESNGELKKALAKKQDELDALIRRFFGHQSERFEDGDQLKFSFANDDELDDVREGILQAIEENKQAGKNNKPPKRRDRKERFPESLPRKEIIIDLPEDEKEGLRWIGEDIVESAHYTGGSVHIVRKIFPKYVRKDDPKPGVLQAPRPPALIQGDRYDTSFAAAVIANRLGYHLPIYRQEDMFASCGLYLSRSTLLNLQENAARVLRPFASWLADLVRSDACIGSDDTSVRLLLPNDLPEVKDDDPKSGRVREVFEAARAKGLKSVSAKMWAYRGVDIPINVFDFTVSRHRDGPDLFLVDEGYEGSLLGDCYRANTGIYIRSSGSIVHAACVAHARRKVEASLGNHQVHAKYLLELFRLLYDIEDEAREKSTSERLSLRRNRSLPIWNRMRAYLDDEMPDIVSTDSISDARRYILNQWSGLTAHLCDGRIPIDNNLCEQLMKQVALGRKNWLHVGSVGSGYRTATLMTIVSSAVRNDLDVATYLGGYLERVALGQPRLRVAASRCLGAFSPESDPSAPSKGARGSQHSPRARPASPTPRPPRILATAPWSPRALTAILQFLGVARPLFK